MNPGAGIARSEVIFSNTLLGGQELAILHEPGWSLIAMWSATGKTCQAPRPKKLARAVAWALLIVALVGSLLLLPLRNLRGRRYGRWARHKTGGWQPIGLGRGWQNRWAEPLAVSRGSRNTGKRFRRAKAGAAAVSPHDFSRSAAPYSERVGIAASGMT